MSRASTSPASCKVALCAASIAAAEGCSRSANSARRSRRSSARLNDVTSHCRTLPSRCSSRLPMLFEAGLGRHQTCSWVSGSTVSRSRGQFCSSSLCRENSKNSLVTSGPIAVIGLLAPSAILSIAGCAGHASVGFLMRTAEKCSTCNHFAAHGARIPR